MLATPRADGACPPTRRVRSGTRPVLNPSTFPLYSLSSAFRCLLFSILSRVYSYLR